MDNKFSFLLTLEEKKLIEFIRELKFGTIELVISEGNPIYADNVKKRISFKK